MDALLPGVILNVIATERSGRLRLLYVKAKHAETHLKNCSSNDGKKY